MLLGESPSHLLLFPTIRYAFNLDLLNQNDWLIKYTFSSLEIMLVFIEDTSVRLFCNRADGNESVPSSRRLVLEGETVVSLLIGT